MAIGSKLSTCFEEGVDEELLDDELLDHDKELVDDDEELCVEDELWDDDDEEVLNDESEPGMVNTELDAEKLVEELLDDELFDEEEGLLGDDEKLGIEDELLEAKARMNIKTV